MRVQDLCGASENYGLIGVLGCGKKMREKQVNFKLSRNLNDEL